MDERDDGPWPQKRQWMVPKGELPSPLDPPKGCVFSTRCPYVSDLCQR
jgi:dipeptide transport system ATP-binding protein